MTAVWIVAGLAGSFVLAVGVGRGIRAMNPAANVPDAPVVPAGDLLDSPRVPLTPAELGEFYALTDPLEAERDRRLS